MERRRATTDDLTQNREAVSPMSEGAMGEATSRESFCSDLIAARTDSGMTLNQIADVTRIPTRSLEWLESGQFEKLPADVFIRGFLRSYCRCVGLDVEETIRRYARCGMTPAPVASPLVNERGSTSSPFRARRPTTASDASAAPAWAEATQRMSLIQRARRALTQNSSTDEPVGESERSQQEPASGDFAWDQVAKNRAASSAEPVDIARSTDEQSFWLGDGAADKPISARDGHDRAATHDSMEADEPINGRATASLGETSASHCRPHDPDDADDLVEATAADEPVESAGVADSTSTKTVRKAPVRAPSLVIDDDYPELAALQREERDKGDAGRDDPTWRSFLPPSLFDNETGARRNALTLAVIILVIVATLTMSYLLRRPSDSGDGVTQRTVIQNVVIRETVIEETMAEVRGPVPSGPRICHDRSDRIAQCRLPRC
ncbi:MAG: helix-turn-helix domain-containing protein [Proteobacteria bacterium]|nr:helix-turn-helix domain-containing protein [Pseudomonadota bacterium]